MRRPPPEHRFPWGGALSRSEQWPRTRTWVWPWGEPAWELGFGRSVGSATPEASVPGGGHVANPVPLVTKATRGAICFFPTWDLSLKRAVLAWWERSRALRSGGCGGVAWMYPCFDPSGPWALSTPGRCAPPPPQIPTEPKAPLFPPLPSQIAAPAVDHGPDSCGLAVVMAAAQEAFPSRGSHPHRGLTQSRDWEGGGDRALY